MKPPTQNRNQNTFFTLLGLLAPFFYYTSSLLSANNNTTEEEGEVGE